MPRDIPVGNGSLLVNFDDKYQLRDIYWPYVGMENHTGGHPSRFGIWVDDRFFWTDDPGWQRQLLYEQDTLVTNVTLFHPQLNMTVVCHDVVDFHENLFLRQIIVHNHNTEARSIRIFFPRTFTSPALRWVIPPIMNQNVKPFIIIKAGGSW